MKNITLTLLLLGITNTYAQMSSFGFKVGANFATLTNNDNFDSKFGFNFGAVGDIELSNTLSWQPEILYSAQGYEGTFNNEDVRAKIDYFIIPMMLDYEFVNNLSIQAGPQFGFNIRSEREIGTQEPQNLNVRGVDVSAAFGLQYFFDSNFFIQGRYALGLNEVVINEDNQNSVFSFSVGFFVDRFGSKID